MLMLKEQIIWLPLEIPISQVPMVFFEKNILRSVTAVVIVWQNVRSQSAVDTFDTASHTYVVQIRPRSLVNADV